MVVVELKSPYFCGMLLFTVVVPDYVCGNGLFLIHFVNSKKGPAHMQVNVPSP